jgi:predicted AAA+ superfamily ATPase
MKRDLETTLKNWKNHPSRAPLRLRGARQVGKTYLIEQFGQRMFKNSVSINFEFHPEFGKCFETLDPTTILNKLSLMAKQKIEPGETLLFLDEMQECPNSILALRYFKEKLPQMHVIGAGSLMEFVLNDEKFRMPVGRIQSFYLHPLSFKEYLAASGNQMLREHLEQATLQQPPDNVVHNQLLQLIREYMAIGGMPAVINEYLRSRQVLSTQQVQSLLLNDYRSDFSKYAGRANHKYLQNLFEKIPGLIAQPFKYVHVDRETKARDIKNALELLENAGLIYLIYSTQASGLPLISLRDDRKFKVLFLDIGLVNRSGNLSLPILMREDILLVNRGAVAEQLVGQELLAHQDVVEKANLFFWQRENKSSTAEVDFIIAIDQHIIPIEVKAGATGRLRSLQIFMQEKSSPLGARISQLPLSLDTERKILNVPIYMISELTRLGREAIG